MSQVTRRAFVGKLAFCSNFYPAGIEHEGIWYGTVEHAFQASKSLNPLTRHAIAKLPTPGDAKRYGRSLALRPDWEQVKEHVMLELLRVKFGRDATARLLVATGDDELVEWNYWHDQTWGSCLCPAHSDTPGQNLLGKLLMQIRAELQS